MPARSGWPGQQEEYDPFRRTRVSPWQPLLSANSRFQFGCQGSPAPHIGVVPSTICSHPIIPPRPFSSGPISLWCTGHPSRDCRRLEARRVHAPRRYPSWRCQPRPSDCCHNSDFFDHTLQIEASGAKITCAAPSDYRSASIEPRSPPPNQVRKVKAARFLFSP
jgi:hypothetical protein